MKKLILGFAGLAVVITLMLNYGPQAIGSFGTYMLDEMEAMACAVWEGNGGEYAKNVLQEYDRASKNTLNGLEDLSNEALAILKEESETEGKDTLGEKAELTNALSEAVDWVFSFFAPKN